MAKISILGRMISLVSILPKFTIPFKIFSKEYNALQLYMTWRGRGLKIETPAVRK